MHVLSLLNPAKLAITCVGYAPSCRRRCRNPIAAQNISSAKVVMRELVRADLSDDEVKNLLFELAEYLLCRRCHQGQAGVVSDGWWRLVQAHLEREEEEGSDTSDDGDDGDDDTNSDGSGSDSDSDSEDGSGGRRNRGNENTPLPAEDFLLTLERLQREFDELLQKQRQHLLRGNNSTVPAIRARQLRNGEAHQIDNSLQQRLTEQKAEREAEQLRREEAYLLAQREREEARERSRRATAEAEQARREEAQRQAAREKAQREAEAERLRQEEEAAEAEAKRLRQEEEEAAAAAEKARQDKERQRQARAQAWDDAWLRYEQAWSEVSSTGKPSELDVRMSSIWPTKTGSYSSCSESNVKLFFISQPGSVSRNVIRRQALRWHPDRAARLFGHVKDESQLRELMKAVTMISQVVIGIMAIASR
jgi:flagellar biosynthesis GTPase FlhF